jgi:predicted Zn finger-like uncharacterized protein
MKDVTPSEPPKTAADMPPPPCPSCRSTATVTTSPNPNAESYWRCTKCGDVWNVARAQADRYRTRHWR